jgi:murein L,D-transpeptidase YafK
MKLLRVLLVIMVGFALTACSSKFRTYRGPEVTAVQVHKAERKMYLLHNERVLETYNIHLGGQPVGAKQFEGDRKTPEGLYYISHKNPNSTYHLSLGISYPNDQDRAFAAAAGKRTGGDIFIHGGPPKQANGRAFKTAVRDWTAGCIAISDKQIEEVYSMIKPGTPIFIMP